MTFVILYEAILDLLALLTGLEDVTCRYGKLRLKS
jgi:hypothetical protein